MHEHAAFPKDDMSDFWLKHSAVECWIQALTLCDLNFKRTLFIYNTRDCYAWEVNNQYFKIKQYEDWKNHGKVVKSSGKQWKVVEINSDNQWKLWEISGQ